MIVKFFKHGTGGSKGVFDYLLKDKEQPDGKRVDAEVFRGDIDNQALLIDSLDFKQKYTSGCLSFTETADQVTQAQKNALMDGFEQTIRAGLDVDRVAVSWIEHRDKGRLELNFVFANVDLEHGRVFQPYVHSVDKRRVNEWKDMQNIKHGFTDPNDPANKRLMAQRDNLPRDIKDARQAITEGLQALVIEGMITNRDDVIQALTSSGFEIARETDKAISIKNPAGKRNIRLTGGLYERDFNFSSEIQNTVTAASTDYRARSTERYDAAKQLYDSEITRKRDYHQARHHKPRYEQRAVAKNLIKESNRYEYCPRNLYEQCPSPYQSNFSFSVEKYNNDVRELHTAHGTANQSKRKQDSSNNEIRTTKLARRRNTNRILDTLFGDSFGNVSSEQTQYLDPDYADTGILPELPEAIGLSDHGQTIARKSESGITSTKRDSGSSEADAGRQRQGYSGLATIIENISKSSNARDTGVTEVVQSIKDFDGHQHRRIQNVGQSSETLRTETDGVSEAINSIVRCSDSAHRAIEELSKYVDTKRQAGDRYERIRECVKHVEQYSKTNRDFTKQNNKFTERNRLRSDEIERVIEQTREAVKSDKKIKANTIKDSTTLSMDF